MWGVGVEGVEWFICLVVQGFICLEFQGFAPADAADGTGEEEDDSDKALIPCEFHEECACDSNLGCEGWLGVGDLGCVGVNCCGVSCLILLFLC